MDKQAAIGPLGSSPMEHEGKPATTVGPHPATDAKIAVKVTCDECGQQVSSEPNLKRHKKTKHSDVRPFHCPVQGCPRATMPYARSDALRFHMGKAHNLVPEKSRPARLRDVGPVVPSGSGGGQAQATQPEPGHLDDPESQAVQSQEEFALDDTAQAQQELAFDEPDTAQAQADLTFDNTAPTQPQLVFNEPARTQFEFTSPYDTLPDQAQASQDPGAPPLEMPQLNIDETRDAQVEFTPPYGTLLDQVQPFQYPEPPLVETQFDNEPDLERLRAENALLVTRLRAQAAYTARLEAELRETRGQLAYANGLLFHERALHQVAVREIKETLSQQAGDKKDGH